jgi:hypothetical protein
MTFTFSLSKRTGRQPIRQRSRPLCRTGGLATLSRWDGRRASASLTRRLRENLGRRSSSGLSGRARLGNRGPPEKNSPLWTISRNAGSRWRNDARRRESPELQESPATVSLAPLRKARARGLRDPLARRARASRARPAGRAADGAVGPHRRASRACDRRAACPARRRSWRASRR